MRMMTTPSGMKTDPAATCQVLRRSRLPSRPSAAPSPAPPRARSSAAPADPGVEDAADEPLAGRPAAAEDSRRPEAAAWWPEPLRPRPSEPASTRPEPTAPGVEDVNSDPSLEQLPSGVAE